MRAPTVSVVLTTYNRAALVVRAVQSVLEQTLQGFELIVVVDGSTDDTLERLKPFAEIIKVVVQSNAGLGAARNAGIAAARGRHIAFLDDDDLWHRRKLEIQLAYLESHPQCSIAIAAVELRESPGTLLCDYGRICRADGVVDAPLLKVASGLLIITPSATIYDRQVAPEAKFLAKRGCVEDARFLIEVLSKGCLGVASVEPLVRYAAETPGSLAKSVGVWVAGVAEMRRMMAAGELQFSWGADVRDVREYIGFLGRVAVIESLDHRKIAAGLHVYCREFGHQLRLRRINFLLTVPALALLRSAGVKPRRRTTIRKLLC